MPLIYCMISHGNEVLCECTNKGLDGNFSTVSKQILQQISSDPSQRNNKKLTFVFEGHTFNFQRAEFEGSGATAAAPAREELFFMCMCDETFGRSRPFTFLKDVTEGFRKLFPKITSSDPSTYHSFSSVLAQKMQQHSAATAPDSTIGNIQAGLDDVKDVMVQNMEKVIKRGEAIEVLVDKSEQLTTHSERFRSSSGKLQRAMCWAQFKSHIMVGIVLLVIVYLLAASVCGLTFSSC